MAGTVAIVHRWQVGYIWRSPSSGELPSLAASTKGTIPVSHSKTHSSPVISSSSSSRGSRISPVLLARTNTTEKSHCLRSGGRRFQLPTSSPHDRTVGIPTLEPPCPSSHPLVSAYLPFYPFLIISTSICLSCTQNNQHLELLSTTVAEATFPQRDDTSTTTSSR